MNLIQEHAGFNWRTDDPAGMYLTHSGNHHAPSVIAAHRIGHVCVNEDIRRVPIHLRDLTFLASAFFGPGRGEGTKWTGDSYKFAIYKYAPEFGRPKIVILRTDGGGTYWYFLDDSDALATWTDLIALLPEPRLWDLCSTLTHSFHRGESKARAEERQAFAEGRMKKRRKKGRVIVEVTSGVLAKCVKCGTGWGGYTTCPQCGGEVK